MKKTFKVVGLLVAIVVAVLVIASSVWIFNVEDVPVDIMQQFNEDSGSTTDTTELQKMDDLFNDPEFDFDFDDQSEEVLDSNAAISV